MKWALAFFYAFWIILMPFILAVYMILVYPVNVWKTWKILVRDCAVDTLSLKTGNVIMFRRKK